MSVSRVDADIDLIALVDATSLGTARGPCVGLHAEVHDGLIRQLIDAKSRTEPRRNATRRVTEWSEI